VIEINLTNTIFLFCGFVGGGLLLLTIVVDDVLGGFLDALHIGIDFAGVSLVLLLLGFVSMFGVGGLLGTEVLHLDGAQASLVGAVSGLLGACFVTAIFRFLRRAESAETFSLQDILATALRAVLGLDRYGALRLADLERSGPGPLRTLWHAAAGELETHYGDVTIREFLARARGRSSGGGATPTH
jgi:hypothetical protein